MTGLQATLAAFSIELLAAGRAFVTGESLYSKGQKDAQIYLLEYAENHREADYIGFMAALAVPLGDRQARESLQKAEPDLGGARRGCLDGGNHPDDVTGLIRAFRWFQHIPLMATPIATWTQGDQVIEQMRAVVDRARERIQAGDTDAQAVRDIRAQAPILNARLTQLESNFSRQLGEASRTSQQLLLGLNVTIALLLTVSGLAFVRRSASVQSSTQAEVTFRKESLQRLLDSAAEGLYGVDIEGRCTFVNRAALKMLGYEQESDLLGRDIHALIHYSRADGRPYPASESNVYHAYRARLASHSVDEVLWRRDGSSFPVESWSHPVVHNDELHGAVATFFDISERVKMRAALRRGEQRSERLIEAVTDGVVTISADQKVVLFNRAAEAMFGVAAASAIGSPVGRFFSSDLRLSDGVASGASDGASDGGVDGGAETSGGALRELVGHRADGQAFPVEASLSHLDTEDGLLTTIVLRDVTALHQANAERRAHQALEAANRAKTEFLSRMSHELRTPLNAVIGFAQLMRMDSAKPLSLDQFTRVQHIENAGAHLLALVNDVLDLSRIESGSMSITQGAVPLAMVVEAASTMVSPLVTEAGVEVVLSRRTLAVPGAPQGRHTSSAPDPLADDIWVKADEVRLRQILVNLLSNAVKYNRPGGRVVLSWTVDSGQCEVLVEDTGLGIAADKLAGLFEPFNRLGAEFSGVEGTGIGLVLSRQLAQMMGGELRISSNPGAGTTASLTLQLASAPPTRASLPPQPRHSDVRNDACLSVLYAEDDTVNAELVRQIFTLRPSMSLRVAENGAAALEMAQSDWPDLMLVDMNLGDMTGIELAHALQEVRTTRELRLIALSADALPEQIEAAMRNGFEGYLTKPINFQALLSLLDAHFQEAANDAIAAKRLT